MMEDKIMDENENKFSFENPEYRHTYWHTCSHVLAQAVKRLYPEVKLAIGPAIENGFYYDMDSPFPFTPEIMEKIEAEMRKICKEKLKLERFIGIITEHFAGAFPVWLSPVQVKVMPITDRTSDYANDVAAKLSAAGVRVETDLRNEKIGYKIREAQMQKTPYMLVIGDREAESGAVAVRTRSGEDLGAMPLDAFIERITGEIKSRSNG